MGILKVDEIRGYSFKAGGIVCSECATQEEANTAKEDEILTEKDIEGDDIYFCDRCKERL